MLKPTSNLLADLITFVMNDQQVSQTLGRRDNDSETWADNINSSFYRSHPGNNSKAGYLLQFNYRTRSGDREQSDDVEILVEVTDGKPPVFEIKNVRFY